MILMKLQINKNRKQDMTHNKTFKAIIETYEINSDNCSCSLQDGEACPGCCPKTEHFEWLIARVKQLEEALEEINNQFPKDYVVRINEIAREALTTLPGEKK